MVDFAPRPTDGADGGSRPAASLTVVGLGAIGGSVALAVLERWPTVPVFGVEPDPDNAAQAAAAGVRIVPGLEDCDLRDGVVVFATPLDVTLRLVDETAETWSLAAMATDVASLKLPVERVARDALKRPRPGKAAFVGSHPMCGTERSGFGAARADLFEGSTVWVCPIHSMGAGAALFWALLGGQPLDISARRHDRLMVQASHTPQLLATALAAALDDAGVKPGELGPGGRDMTRLARSSPEMWMPLLNQASAADSRALARVEEWIGRIRRMLDGGDMSGLEALMRKGGAWAGRGE